MIASALIVFREALEAALVIGIMLGATRGIKGRRSAVLWGVGTGVAGALAVAALMGRISQAASGTGQALFEAAVLFTAVVMLGWHNVWMSRHGKRLAQDLKALGGDVTSGLKPMTALYAAAALAVLREGSEIVLFLYGLAASGAGAASLAAGGALGLAAGAAAGAALYFGLAKIPVRFFFKVTAWMILLLAAGMASQAAAFLNQALLKTLVGYTPNPSGIQFAFYGGTIILIASLMKLAEE
jgi:high-affinity iron transporter